MISCVGRKVRCLVREALWFGFSVPLRGTEKLRLGLAVICINHGLYEAYAEQKTARTFRQQTVRICFVCSYYNTKSLIFQ